jgi:hypothetical protein
MPAPTMTLKQVRADEAREFSFYCKVVQLYGIKGTESSTIQRIEDLNQLARNEEFRQDLSEDELKRLTIERKRKVEGRINKGEAPFEKVYFEHWTWDQGRKAYRWTHWEHPKDVYGERYYQPRDVKEIISKSKEGSSFGEGEKGDY